jgi:hypothetical protein
VYIIAIARLWRDGNDGGANDVITE